MWSADGRAMFFSSRTHAIASGTNSNDTTTVMLFYGFRSSNLPAHGWRKRSGPEQGSELIRAAVFKAKILTKVNNKTRQGQDKMWTVLYSVARVLFTFNAILQLFTFIVISSRNLVKKKKKLKTVLFFFLRSSLISCARNSRLFIFYFFCYHRVHCLTKIVTNTVCKNIVFVRTRLDDDWCLKRKIRPKISTCFNCQWNVFREPFGAKCFEHLFFVKENLRLLLLLPNKKSSREIYSGHRKIPVYMYVIRLFDIFTYARALYTYIIYRNSVTSLPHLNIRINKRFILFTFLPITLIRCKYSRECK